MMTEQEQEHWDHEVNAPIDYLWEAFGADAHKLAMQARQEAEDDARREQDEWEAFIGPRLPVQYAEPIGPSLDDDVPF